MTQFASRPLRVFLCHSSGDKPAVRELYRQLSSEGWMDVWLDEVKLLPGQDWNLEIEKALDQSDAVIVTLSTGSVTKEGYVQRELRAVLDIALEKPEGTIFVLPLRLEECERPRRLRSIQGVDYFPPEDRESAYAKLLQSLELRASNLRIETSQSGSRSESAQSIAEQEIPWPDGSRMVLLPIDTNSSMAFFMSRHPITNKQYRAFVEETKVKEPQGQYYDRQRSGWRRPFRPWQDQDFSDDSLPVVCVSYEDAQDYCKWVNELCSRDGRASVRKSRTLLPWVRIWEFAAFSGSSRSFRSGDWLKQTRRIHHKANFPAPIDTSGMRTNTLGISDLFGNVWEWCSARDETDPYSSAAMGAVTRGSIAGGKLTISNRNTAIVDDNIESDKGSDFGGKEELDMALRGGGFLDDLAAIAPFETASRLDDKHYTRHSDLGFRICAKVPLHTLSEETMEYLSNNAVDTWD